MIDIEEIYQQEIQKFGHNVRKLRLEQGIERQIDLGRLCEMDRTQISRIERGIYNVEVETMIRLAVGLKKGLPDLFNYNANKFGPFTLGDSIDIQDLIREEKRKLGAKLLQLRENLHLTQLDVEVVSGIGRSAISEYENGAKMLSFVHWSSLWWRYKFLK